jgi:RNA polymerase sigma-70 factor (ECF subfamily)
MLTPERELKEFNLLFTGYRERFIRFANAYVRDMAVAEDVTTDAFMYYWEHRHALPPDVNLPAYLLTIIKHNCLNHLEHIRIREAASEALKKHAEWELQTRISTLEACEPNDLFSTEIREIVEKTLATLPAQTRQIFIMSRYENRPYKEIAVHFDMTVKGVEFHIAKAIKRLSRSLKDYLSIFIGLFF